jgi:hypothetical protein
MLACPRQLLPPECILYAQEASADVKLMQESFRYMARSKQHVVDANNYNIKPLKRETHMLKLITGV